MWRQPGVLDGGPPAIVGDGTEQSDVNVPWRCGIEDNEGRAVSRLGHQTVVHENSRFPQGVDGKGRGRRGIADGPPERNFESASADRACAAPGSREQRDAIESATSRQGGAARPGERG